MHHKGCRIQVKWTPSDKRIEGNAQADRPVKAGCKAQECKWTRTNLKWLRVQPRTQTVEKWEESHNLPHRPKMKQVPPISNLSRQSSGAIAQLRLSTTSIRKSPKKPPSPCDCGTGKYSAKHASVDCPLHATARKVLYNKTEEPHPWASIKGNGCRPRDLLEFKGLTGIIRVRVIITKDQDARN